MNRKFFLAAFVAVNAGLGLMHVFFGFTGTADGGLSSEGYFFLLIALLFFVVATGFAFKNRWIVILGSIPLALISCMFAFLIAGGGWIWGPPRGGQMYLFILASILIAVLEIAGIISIIRYSKKEPPVTLPPQL